jgi:hypothetical protein
VSVIPSNCVFLSNKCARDPGPGPPYEAGGGAVPVPRPTFGWRPPDKDRLSKILRANVQIRAEAARFGRRTAKRDQAKKQRQAGGAHDQAEHGSSFNNGCICRICVLLRSTGSCANPDVIKKMRPDQFQPRIPGDRYVVSGVIARGYAYSPGIGAAQGFDGKELPTRIC